MTCTFSKEMRLRCSVDIKKTLQGNRRFIGKHFKLIWSKTDLSCARLCVIVSKKTSKHAVDRNRIRRVLRESFRESSFVQLPCDLVMIARKGSVQVTNRELRQCFDDLLNRLAGCFQ